MVFIPQPLKLLPVTGTHSSRHQGSLMSQVEHADNTEKPGKH